MIGTQMISKGHHFPGVNLVGVLYAEEGLNYPDFRSAERTFRQLTQVAGRSGRGGTAGEVVVQTFMPEHYVFEYLKCHDYDGFMSEELRVRKQLGYPPYSRVVLASLSGRDQILLHRVIERWTGELRTRMAAAGDVAILGPAPPLVPRVKNRYREQVLIKGKISSERKALAIDLFKHTQNSEKGARAIELRWDVDPESFV